ncbi:MAG TPA: hypothetical protein VHZ55_04025 [Bryobacteraceae bacterium]|nr:hypothetical protein [Bryobacteraceae bacterium]
MTATPHIARKTGTPGEDTFEGLRAQGMQYVEDLGRYEWTDYNEHDPGVTMLEQLCYALTDVMYRADFPVEDLLSAEHGGIDWQTQGLLPPERAFPARPTTPLDYEDVLYSAVFEAVENVQVKPVAGTGRYRIELRLRDKSEDGPASKVNLPAVIKEVRRRYDGLRNLGEDLDEICVLEEQEFILRADVEIDESADPALVLARIYNECSAKIAAGLSYKRFDLRLSEGAGPEEILRGPFTPFGVVADKGPSLRSVTEQDLYDVITAIDEVLNVAVDTSQMPRLRSLAVLRLRVPRNEQEIEVKISVAGRRVRIPWHDFMMRYKQIHSFSRAAAYRDSDFSLLVPRPEGKWRNPGQYESVQHGFPAVYGMGCRGLPHSAPAKRQAQARQLQAWLLFFDQHLADYLAMLEHTRELFSICPPQRETYFAKVLDRENVPGIEHLYPVHPEDALRKLLQTYNHSDRIKRLLDYFLALYGETFRDVSPYVPSSANGGTAAEAEVEGRLAFLRQIEGLSRDRAAGTNCSRPAGPDNVSGLEARLNRLLGFHPSGTKRVRLVEHVLLRRAGAPDASELAFAFRITVLLPSADEIGVHEPFRQFAQDTLEANCPAHIYADVRWVSPETMERFDELYGAWWTALQQARERLSDEKNWRWDRTDESSAAADALRQFLLGLGPEA